MTVPADSTARHQHARAAAAAARLEEIERVAAVRTVCEAIVEGRWTGSAIELLSLQRLVGSAAFWAKIADDLETAA